MVATDHYNDCRRATGDVLLVWFCTPTEFVSASILLYSSEMKGDKEGERSPWVRAAEIFVPRGKESWLRFYESSPGRRRSFCGRCGTNLSFVPFPVPEGWPDRLDFVLGSVDRVCLEGNALRPERQLWWDYGIEWVKEMTVKGVGELPRRPDYKVNGFV
jgi:hypothetical protein